MPADMQLLIGTLQEMKREQIRFGVSANAHRHRIRHS